MEPAMSNKVIFFLAFASALTVIFGCSPLESAAGSSGGSSGGEAFAQISGIVRDTTGAALENALVVMRQSIYSAEVSVDTGVYKDTTDENGVYGFNNVSPGEYLLYAFESVRNVARAHPVHVDESGESIFVDTLTLGLEGTLSCTIDKEYLHDTVSIILNVLGANKERKSANGVFDLSLAPGVYAIAVASANDRAHPAIIRDITVNPGEKTVIEGIGLPFQQIEDSLRVAWFLDSQGIAIDLFDEIVRVSFNRIRGLDFSRSGIASLHESIGTLSFLHSIVIKKSEGVSLPDTLGALPALSSFVCTYSRLAEFPPALIRCKNLRTLSVEGNNLTSLPPSFGNLTELRTFNGAANAFTSVPAPIFSCEKLRTLDLSGNQLDSLPWAIERLSSLETLVLSSNNIFSLPPSLGTCTRLVSLRLWSNSLTGFPAAILGLTSLKELYLQDNRIAEIPDSISALANLRVLLFSGNELTALPSSITSLTNLTKVTVADNKLCAPKSSIEQWLDQVAEGSWRTSQRECE